ncbi:p21-activated protein kinase-interacting protein 1-like protein, partial [Grifola frondosa]
MSAKPSVNKLTLSSPRAHKKAKHCPLSEDRFASSTVRIFQGEGEAASSNTSICQTQIKCSTSAKICSPSVVLPSTKFKAIVGSYEKLLYGLQGTISIEDADYKFHLKPIFIFPAHVSCIKAVAASPQGGKWLATGSADEIVKVWDLRRRKEIGGLMHHEGMSNNAIATHCVTWVHLYLGSITHLEFPSRSHLLSASEDGTLCLFRARDWAVLRSLKGHKVASGKVALSVGKDRTLRMWDLMRGKGSASTKLGKEGEIVRWSTDGSMFAVQSQSTIDVYSTDMDLLHTITHPSRLHDIKFCKRIVGEGEVLLAAAEDKKLSIYDVSSDADKPPTVVAEMIGHTNRVKAVDTLTIALPPSASRSSTTIVCTISSDGKIYLYDMAALPASPQEKIQLSPVAEYDTKGTRLTCLALADSDMKSSVATNGKRKRTEDDEDDGESGSENAQWASQPEEDDGVSEDGGENDDDGE